MKLAFLSFYSGQVERGVEIWIEELTKRLMRNHSITVYHAGKKVNLGIFQHINMMVDWQHKDTSGAFKRKLYLDYWSKKILDFTRLSLKKINQDDPDVIIPTNGGWESLLTRVYALRKQKKILIVGHSGIGWDDYMNLWVKPDAFIALNTQQKKWAVKNSLGTKVVQIPDGVDVDKFTPSGEKINLDLPRPIILVVSALSPGKRVDLAIKAVSFLGKGSLIVLGKGDSKQTAYIENLGKQHLGNNFILKYIPHKTIAKWYRSCDLLTLPSWDREAFGMVLLEAMACNRPVVTTCSEARKEIVSDGGLLCDPYDITTYSTTLGKALSIDFADKPRKQAERYSWEIIADQYNKLLQNL